MAQAHAVESGSKLRIVSKLSDIKDSFKWYSLHIPELATLQPRVGHSIVSHKDGKLLMIGGGNHGGAVNEVVLIDLEPDSINDAERVVIHPANGHFPPRYEFLCAKDSDNACAWIFGGADTENTSNDVIKIDEESVETINCSNGIVPSPRTQGNNSALVEFQGKKCIAVFAGGLKGEQTVQDRDLYLFDTLDRKWEKISVKLDAELADLPFACQPPLVQGHAMTSVGTKIFVHGGINNTTLYDGYHWMDLKKENDDHTYSWLASSATDTCPVKPKARAAHGIARVSDVDQSSPLVYIFGGIGEKGAFNDLWCFNMDSMCWTQIRKGHGKDNVSSTELEPTPRLDFAMCTVGLPGQSSDSPSSVSVYIMIHGGMNREGEIFNDAWVMRVN